MSETDTSPDSATNDHERQSNETRWIDAWTRWERRESFDDEDDDDDDYDDVETQAFQFHFPSTNTTPIHVELEGFAMDSQQAWCSTGLTPWRSGRVLCEYLVQHPEQLLLRRGSLRILECGSGLGLCGLVAHAILVQQQQPQSLAADSSYDTEVVLTDGDTDTLRQLRANVQRNVVGASADKANNTNHAVPNIACHQLVWGTAEAHTFAADHGGAFDVILGSDLIYVHAIVERLWETVEVLLSKTNPDARFLMAYCPRQTAASDQRKVTLQDILDAAELKGFVHEECCVEEEQEGGTIDDGGVEKITVHIFRWG